MRVNKTVSLFQRIAKAFSPPPKLNVSQWADAYRKLSSESSAEAGQWRTSRAPYQREIMDSINDPRFEEIIVMSSSQVGKTEILNNVIGYFIDYDASPMMVVQYSLETAEAYSKDRIAPMIRDCPSLAKKVVDVKAKNSGNTILHKQFPGGHLTMVGANAPAGLAMRPIRILLFDEVDRYPPSAGTEGDPIKLATKRTDTFWNRRIVKMSTPGIEGESRIEADYLLSSKGEWCLPCPSCGEYQPLDFHRINRELCEMECRACGALDTQYNWKRDNMSAGKWVHEEPDNPRRGFHLNALASPWLKWETIVQDFLDAKDNPEMLKPFVNTVLGETWEDRGAQVEESTVEKRTHYYNCQVPDKVLLLTAGVDVQDDHLEVEVVGWCEGQESFGIEYVMLFGDPRQNGVWKSLDEYLVKAFSYASGQKIGISCTCIDSGGHATDEVYKYCAQREQMRVFAIKGRGGYGLPVYDRPKRNNKYKALLFILGVDTLKDLFHTRLKLEHEGEGYCHFPKESDTGYSADVLKGFISEQKFKQKTSNGGYKYVWKKKGGVRNEPLDCRNYATAAMRILEPNFELYRQMKNGETRPRPAQRSQRGKNFNNGVQI